MIRDTIPEGTELPNTGASPPFLPAVCYGVAHQRSGRQGCFPCVPELEHSPLEAAQAAGVWRKLASLADASPCLRRGCASVLYAASQAVLQRAPPTLMMSLGQQELPKELLSQ